MVLTIFAWVAFYLGGWPRLIVAAAFFVFLGSCVPIAVFRVLEDKARKVERDGVGIILIGLCQAGKAASVLVMVWVVFQILRAWEVI